MAAKSDQGSKTAAKSDQGSKNGDSKKGPKAQNTSTKSGKSEKSAKDKSISKQIYYHYYLPREEVELILSKVGDYLVRETIMADKRAAIILSVRAMKSVEHLPVEFDVENLMFYFVPKVGKPSIPELIEHHRKKAIPIEGCVLKTPIPRNKWEILDDQMKFEEKKLGEGNFAIVYKGQFLYKEKWVVVAVKRLRVDKLKTRYDREKAKNMILREFQTGRVLFGHSRIVASYGMYIGSEELAVVSEFCDGGGLDVYLKKQHEQQITIPVYAKLNFLLNASGGLSYMHSLKLIHRDVAARNFLLVKREHLGQLPLVKVADFGLTRVGPTYEMKTEHEVPYIISAIECLADKNPTWTLKSDCWSFGVLMYDVFNECTIECYSQDVFPLNMTNVREHLEKGGRLKAHEMMPSECSILMEKCFDADPKKRPAMKEIKEALIPLVKKLYDERK